MIVNRCCSDAEDPIAEFGPASRFQIFTPITQASQDDTSTLSFDSATVVSSSTALNALSPSPPPTLSLPFSDKDRDSKEEKKERTPGFLGFLGGLAGLVQKRMSPSAAANKAKDIKFDVRGLHLCLCA